MSCSFTEKISLLIDGELSAAEARDVERHLVTCMQCAEARADFLSLRSQINSFEAAAPRAVSVAMTRQVPVGRTSRLSLRSVHHRCRTAPK